MSNYTHCRLFYTLLLECYQYCLWTHKWSVTPRSRNSLTESRGEIISWPQLSYTNIWQTHSDTMHTCIHFLPSKLTSINSFCDLLLSYSVLFISSRFTLEDFSRHWTAARAAMFRYWHLVAIVCIHSHSHTDTDSISHYVPSYSCPYISNAMLECHSLATNVYKNMNSSVQVNLDTFTVLT